MAPWKGQRHRSWASDTVLSTIGMAVVFVTYVVWEIVSSAPPGLTTLLGVAGGAWFGAMSSDRRKRDRDDRDDRAGERGRVDRLERVAEYEHGELMGKLDSDAGDAAHDQ